MKNLISLVVVLAGIISLNAQDLNVLPNNKVAILMVHFGTTFDDTRALTIDAINEKARQTFPGIKKSTPQEALLRLAADGYTHVVVQGTNIIDGIEAEVLRKEAASVAPFFEEISVGHPLLYSVEDCENVAAILASRYKDATDKRGAVVLIGHGTSTPANAIYSQMDYMFKANGNDAFHVATVEGYPTYETTLARLKADRYKTITLLPFMFVAGDHARNDIDGEWRENLEKAGFTVSTVLEGLGQISQIQDIFIEHIKDALTAPVLDALSQKKSYIKENI